MTLVGHPFGSMSVVIDGKGHIEGRLAGAVAKLLLNGKKVVIVRCEGIETNGDHKFNVHKYERFLNKTINTNPRHGQFHFRAPSEMMRKAVRGMIPYKTARGEAAFNRLEVYEGVPAKYAKVSRLVIPQALRVVSITKTRPTTTLGKLATTMGWKYSTVVEHLETKRKEASNARWETVKAEQAKRERAIAAANKQLGEKAVNFIENFVE